MTEQERIVFVDITYLVTEALEAPEAPEALEALEQENLGLADADASVG